MTDTERIIDKISKLQAHADSAAELGSEAEAQAFAAKAQELLTAYKLSQVDVKRTDGKVEEPIDCTYFGWADLGLKERKVRIGWAEILAHNVGQAYYCKFIVSAYGGKIGFFVGRKTDREVATYMFVTLGRLLYKLAERETERYNIGVWRAAGSPRPWTAPPETLGFKAGFIKGFINRLWERFEEEVRPKVDPTVQATTNAIIRVRRDALAVVDAWMEEHLRLESCSRTGLGNSSNAAGRAAGSKAANAVNLRPNAAGSGRAPKELRR